MKIIFVLNSLGLAQIKIYKKSPQGAKVLCDKTEKFYFLKCSFTLSTGTISSLKV